MGMNRTSTAVWTGDGKTGHGILNMQSGVFKGQPYSFKSRFEDESGKSGTNPEELIAAAHAGCFTMALAFKLKEEGFVADELKTDASVTMEKIEGGFRFQRIELNLNAKVPTISKEKFDELARSAKETCPVSLALAGVSIHLNANLQKEQNRSQAI